MRSIKHGVIKNEADSDSQRSIMKVKRRDEAFVIPDGSVFSRLKDLGGPLLPLDPDMLSNLKAKSVSRKDLAARFGGNPQTLVQRPRDSLVLRHGYTHFICPMLSVYPHVPQIPGAHGLLIRTQTSTKEEDELFNQGAGRRHKVVVGLTPKEWLYMGDYEIKKSNPLSKAEWWGASQTVSVLCSDTLTVIFKLVECRLVIIGFSASTLRNRAPAYALERRSTCIVR